MLKLFCKSIIIGLLCCGVIYSQTISNVIVSGWGGQHDEDVKNSFLIGYSNFDSTEFPGNIDLYSYDILQSFKYADVNNIDMIVRSNSDLLIGLFYAPLYPDITLVMPSGSNDFVLTYRGDVSSSPVIISGAGLDSNKTGYQVEFFASDPITNNNLSSFSNGFIAGQIAFIANSLEISIDSARTLARINSSLEGEYNYYSGYGKILMGNIFHNPLPVELSSFTVNSASNIRELKWITQTELNNYGFEVQRKTTYSNNDESDWLALSFIAGAGNSNTPKFYSYADADAIKGRQLKYRLKQIDFDGSFDYSKTATVDIAPAEFELYQNYPNPFNPNSVISFSLNDAGYTTLKIYSLTGELVRTLIDDEKSAGFHSVLFESEGLTSGVYIYKLDHVSASGSISSIRKMNLIR